MNASQLRQKFLEFFESKGHLRHPSGSLVPYDVTGRLDESLLFNGAGMVQFKPYFRGIANPPSKRLTNVQKCVRTGDIEEIGDLTHLSFFGNFSFGDYFKKDAIAYSWEFMTSPEWLGLDPRRLTFTVHDSDDEAFECWSEHVRAAGMVPEHRIFRLDEETNFWPAGAFSKGPPGPCGPNSEMFYWTPKDEPPPTGPYSVDDWIRDEAASKWLEIWNDVFIQYEWKGRLKNPDRPSDGWEKQGMDPLPFQSVDTGMGVERTATVLGGFRSVYSIDSFEPIFGVLKRITSPHVGEVGEQSEPGGGSWDLSDSPEARAARIIADHARSACFCIADGILPGNSGRGYVLRRLIRRAVLKGQRTLGISEPFLHRVYEGVAEALGGHYTELIERRETIVETLRMEEALFRRTLSRGLEAMADPHYLALEQAAIQFRNEMPPISDQPRVDYTLTYIEPDIGFQIHGATGWPLTGVLIRRGDREIQDFAKNVLLQTATRAGMGELAIRFSCIRFPGSLAFQLYDTYGFPLEVTQELCQEAGIEVDIDGFESAMKEAQERSRAAHSGESVYGGVSIRFQFGVVSNQPQEGPTPTKFVGYDTTSVEALIVGAMLVEDGAGGTLVALALDQTPFYAESGGEVSDTGWIRGEGFEFEVVDLTKQDGVYVHLAKTNIDLNGQTPEQLNERIFGKKVIAEVDGRRRRSITRNHTATHLLHAALRNTLGKHVTQAGSLVAPDHLRFDFTHGKAMTDDELAAVEREVNEKSLAAIGVTIHNDIPIEEAKKKGAMALFGEKYGDTVRVVEVPGFSLELCGGCHVRNTAEIGLFKILHEASAASGVRRIEAVTGEAAYEWVRAQRETLESASELLKSNPNELIKAIEKTLDALREEKKKRERLATQMGSSQTAVETVNGVEFAIEQLEDADAKDAQLVADRLIDGHSNRVALVTLRADGKLTFVCKVGADAAKAGAHAGKLVGEVAKVAGGGGGGRPDFATAGGRDPSKLEEAIAKGRETLAAQLGG